VNYIFLVFVLGTKFGAFWRNILLSPLLELHRCFGSASRAPARSATETCAKNAIERCINQKINPLGVYLLGDQYEQHDFDLAEMMQRGDDCAKCIKSAIGASVNPETVRTAQCAAVDICYTSP
jgi:hypothetical protein